MPRLKECPAITALNGALKVFPGLRRDTLVDANPATRHTSGLAIDIFFDSKSAVGRARAMELIEVLCNHHHSMKWSDLIFTDFHIGGGVGGYGGDGRTHQTWSKGAHDDHIHLDWVDFSLRTGPEGSKEFLYNPYEWSERAKQTGWRDPLEADFAVLAAHWAADPTPLSVALPMPAWVAGWWRVVQDGETYFYHFGSGGTVVWTYMHPANQSTPIANAQNSGKCTGTPAGGVTLVWNEVDGMSTVEKFSKISPMRLNGTSNRSGPLTMSRL